ncbi:MAG: hypothetical protein M0R06_03345 [Sphaerochaeta sp.]|jgi:hypothetical protein|nr:hypothetical protein [Sphaerochaeta sp.]
MANEITFGYITGRDLEYGVYNPDGTQVTAPTTSLPEIGATGYYTADNGDIAAGDMVIVHDVTGGGDFICGQGQYMPEVSASEIETKIDTIDTNVDSILTEQAKVQTVEPIPDPVETKTRIYI